MKSKAENLEIARKEHADFLKRMGVTGKHTLDQPKKIEIKEKIREKDNFLERIQGTTSCFKKSIDDYKWKKGANESQETIDAIEEKKKRIAPAYNKGGYQFITSLDDVETLGKKV